MGVNLTERQVEVGILNPEDQQVAQELFDYALEHNGLVMFREDDKLTDVTVTEDKYKSSSVEIYHNVPGKGRVTLNLRRGKRGWQDDGAFAFSGYYGDSSEHEPVSYRPDAKTRDIVVNEVHDVFIAPPTPSDAS